MIINAYRRIPRTLGAWGTVFLCGAALLSCSEDSPTGAEVGSGGSPLSTGGAASGGVSAATGGTVPGVGGHAPASGGMTSGGSSSGGSSSGGSSSGGTLAVGGTPEQSSGGSASGTGGTEHPSGGDGAGGAEGSGGTVNHVDAVCPFEGEPSPEGQNWVAGELLEFNDNGGWCWYQDERVIVDQDTGELIIASVASGGNRNAAVEVTHWDIAAGTGTRHHLRTMSYTDDHDVAGIVKRPDGGYIAMYAGHNDDCNSYYSVYEDGSWSQPKSFAWPECPTPSGKRITYANIWYLGDTIYSYVRSIDTSPNYIFSEDGGQSWRLGGRLTSTPQVGYVAGYYKYWGNNTDRLDFFGTEAHPRDNDNSLYHGYIQDGKIHDSTGKVIDSDFSDRSAQEVTTYSQVFKTGTTIGGVRLEHMWNADLVRYDDGTVAAIGTGRVSGTGSDDPDKRLLYFRLDGTEWKTTYLAKAGTKLYGSEQDYTGLGALDPDNPHVIYISTPFDPRTDEGDFNGKKEIWKGVSCDDGASFDWEPVTANSQVDNLRPVVPKWDAAHTALLWLRGSYTSAQSYDFKVVGLIEDLTK